MPTHMEEIAPKAMGAVKTVKAAVEGLHGVFRQLTEEHGEVAALLMRVKANSEPDDRARLFARIRAELLSHEQGELRAVYPAFMERPELMEMASHHGAEATEMQALIETLHVTSPSDPSWAPTFDELVEKVLQHTKEEENDYFPAAVRVLGTEEADRMLPQYQSVKAEVMKAL